MSKRPLQDHSDCTAAMLVADSKHAPHIVDVRIRDLDAAQNTEDEGNGAQLQQEIIEGLSKPNGQKTMPTMLLYDERGLRLYDRITTDCPEYYLFPAEETILKTNGREIVQIMCARDGEANANASPVVLELGAGALRKTSHLLLALAGLVDANEERGPITYYALDLEKRELERTLTELMATYGNALDGKVQAKGMWGTYDGGLKYVQEGGIDAGSPGDSSVDLGPDTRKYRTYSASTTSSRSDCVERMSTPPSSTGHSDSNSSPPLHLLFLGSSLGNFDRLSAVEFLRSLPLRPGSGDTLLIGLDHDNTKDQIELAYNDPKGLTTDFIMNGLRVAGKTLGDEKLFERSNWKYVNKYNEAERSHEAYYESVRDQSIQIPGKTDAISLLADERVNIEVSHKYSESDAYSLFTAADLRPIMRWPDPSGQYSLWLLERPAFTFPLIKSPSATATSFGAPSLNDFRTMWKAWDTITIGMIPRSMLFTKPIDLRHICLFYLGHIPAFLDIHLSRLLGEKHTEPEHFKDIFERGIDPHVDNPNQCHPHSEVPEKNDDWPTLESILEFRDRVRARLTRLYADLESGKRELNRKVGRVLFMTYEHEGFHAETLLYMLLQGAGKADGTLPPPCFTAPHWEALSAQWSLFPAPDTDSVTLGPATVVLGHDDPEALDKSRDLCTKFENVEFGWDNEHPRREVQTGEFKISWRPVSNGEFYEFYEGKGKGVVGFPTSWVKVAGSVQVRTLYGPIPLKIAWEWPVLTSYDDLSKYAIVKGGRIPTEAELRLFFDKFHSGYEGGSNNGFRNWHPVPATTGVGKVNGKGHNGGVWEWTSTLFDKHEGFVNSNLYPGYSSDFFDGKHQVVIGGSYATIPRLSERRTLRNYYQHNYPYPWVAGRVAYDV